MNTLGELVFMRITRNLPKGDRKAAAGLGGLIDAFVAETSYYTLHRALTPPRGHCRVLCDEVEERKALL